MKNKNVFLVGYTGFVGSNLCEQYNFDGLFNSKNIGEAFQRNPDVLVYAGIPAQKFMANSNPKKDFEIIQNAIENIKKINPHKLILISTIDVYESPNGQVEDTDFEVASETYGKNRRYLEEWVINNYQDYLIVRLPGLYGKNLKKNFIYDLINFIPSMLKEEKFNELVLKNPDLKKYYHNENNGFYKCMELNKEEKDKLKEIFKKLNFSALNFTDSRGNYQFYNLSNLWHHIEIALKNNIKVLNIATEPITINELYNYLYKEDFENIIANKIPYYNFKTKYDTIFNGKNGYIFDKNFVLKDIKEYLDNNN